MAGRGSELLMTKVLAIDIGIRQNKHIRVNEYAHSYA